MKVTLQTHVTSSFHESNITHSCNFMHLQHYDILSIKLIKKKQILFNNIYYLCII